MSSPGFVTNWNVTTINGVQYLVIDTASFRVPLDWDPSSNMFIAVAAPNGSLGNFPALVKGDPGDTPVIDTVINFTALDSTDPTPDSAAWTVEAPDLYQLNLALHKGAPGAAGGTTIMTATDLVATGAVSKQMIVVNPAANGFILMSQKVGDRYIPGTILSAPSGNPAYTLCAVPVPAQPFDWRPHVEGYTILTATGTDLQADLVVRLGVETSGSIVARGPGVAGQSPAVLSLASAPPAGSADGFDRVASGAGPTNVYLRVERQSGGSTFTTSNSTTLFAVRPMAVP
jgi:hypothetical protein